MFRDRKGYRPTRWSVKEEYLVRVFTLDELKQFDGRQGRPAYVGFMGKVYDVSDSGLWKQGVHKGLHEAGVDLSRALGRAPHGAGLLGRFSAVGRLVP